MPCTNCGKTNDADDSDDELEEAEILARMREHRLERMEYQREQAKYTGQTPPPRLILFTLQLSNRQPPTPQPRESCVVCSPDSHLHAGCF